MNSTPPLETHLFERLSAAIRQIDPSQAREIYAFYLVLSLDEGGAYWPEVTSLAWLIESDVTPEKAQNYGSKWSGWSASGETVLQLCDETRDAAGFFLQSAFYESLLPDEGARRKWETFQWLWPFRWDEDELTPELKKQLETRLDALEIPASERRYLSSTMGVLAPLDFNAVFFPILENVIHALHASGAVREVCGRDVPIGIMATNDVGYEWGLDPTHRANPPGLARGMEEWMMGEPYAAVEAREKLESEIARLPHQEQAAFWVRCAIETERFFWNDERSGFTDDLEKRGLLRKTAKHHIQYLRMSRRLTELLPEAAPLLIEEFAQHANNEPETYGTGHHKPHQLASHLLSLLEGIAPQGDRNAIPETAIERLREVQRVLWHDAQTRDKIGSCLQYTFRVLHRLRPDRFPLPQHDRRDHNRVLNGSDYNL